MARGGPQTVGVTPRPRARAEAKKTPGSEPQMDTVRWVLRPLRSSAAALLGLWALWPLRLSALRPLASKGAGAAKLRGRRALRPLRSQASAPFGRGALRHEGLWPRRAQRPRSSEALGPQSPRRPKTAASGANAGPRRPQEEPTTAQAGPRGPQDEPKPLDRFQADFRPQRGCRFEAPAPFQGEFAPFLGQGRLGARSRFEALAAQKAAAENLERPQG